MEFLITNVRDNAVAFGETVEHQGFGFAEFLFDLPFVVDVADLEFDVEYPVVEVDVADHDPGRMFMLEMLKFCHDLLVVGLLALD